MHTFLFATSPDPHLADLATQRCCHTLSRVLGSRFGSIVTRREQILAPTYSMCTCRPNDNVSRDLVSELIDDQLATLVFGQLWSGGDETPAAGVAASWRWGGAKAVRRLPGCFGAVVVDRNAETVTILSDMSAQRRLFYYQDNAVLLVSPHDSTLVASGMCPIDIDTVAVDSSFMIDWSLGGRSFLKRVENVCTNFFAVFNKSEMRKVADPILAPSERIDARDKTGLSNHLNEMISAAAGSLTNVLNGQRRFGLTMSAGADSRAVFALTRGTIADAAERIIPICVGDPDSLDVQVAREICAQYQIPYQTRGATVSSPEDFLRACGKAAFANNGDNNAISYIIDAPYYDCAKRTTTILHGNGGEIYRGSYYPTELRKPSSILSIDRARSALLNKFESSGAGLSLEDAAVAALRDRICATVDSYAAMSASGYDLLDLIYTCERNAVWAQGRSRNVWHSYWGPFNDAVLMRGAFRMPAPIGFPPVLHREVIRRYAPDVYWKPVNKKSILPLDDWDFRWQIIGMLYKRVPSRTRIASKLYRTALSVGFPRGRLLSKSSQLGLQEMRRAAFAGTFYDAIVGLVSADRSIVPDLLGNEQMRGLLSKQRIATSTPTTRHLGKAVMIEMWRSVVAEMHEIAVDRG